MSIFTNKFDNNINKKMVDAEMMPPIDMWARIESQLPEDKKRIPWLPIGITSGALLVVSLLTYHFLGNNTPQVSLPANKSTANKSTATMAQDIKVLQETSPVNNGIQDAKTIPYTNENAANTDDKISAYDKNLTASSNKYDGNKKEDKSASIGAFKKNTKNKNSQHSNTSNLYKDEENSIPSSPAKVIQNSIPVSASPNEYVGSSTAIPASQESVVLPSKAVVLQEMHKELEDLLDVKIPEIETPTTAAGIDEVSNNTLKKLENLKQFAGYNVKRGFHIGPYIAITYNWLSRQTDNPENKDLLHHTFQLNKMYGISTGYDFSDRWGVLTELAYAEQGMQYKDNSSDKLYNLKINYIKVPIMMKYKIMFLNEYNSKPIILNLLFGGHYSHLQKCSMSIDGITNDFDQKYNQNEWGLMTGMDFDIYLNKHIYFTSGFRSGFGANTKGFPRLKGSDGNSPVSLQTGIYTKLNFRIPLKIK